MAILDILALIRSLMDAQGVSQSTLAARAGMTQAALSNILAGKQSPKVETLEKLLGEFGYGLAAASLAGGASEAQAPRGLVKNGENTLGLQEVARRLGVSRLRAWQLVNAGRFAGAHKEGRDWVVPASALDAVKLRPTGRPRIHRAPTPKGQPLPRFEIPREDGDKVL